MQTVTALVIKHNKLVEACYDLNINEQKLLIYAISKINPEDDRFNIISIVVKDFVGLFDTVDERYTEIKKLTKSLKRRELLIQTERGDLLTNWFSSIEYIRNKAIIEVEFSSKLIPYLLHIKDMYTKYDIQNIIHMKCKYSIRMYELLKQYEKIGKRELSLNDLKRILGCSNKFNRFSDFNKRVLEPAIEEINDLTDIRVSKPEKIKDGRKIVALSFTIKKAKTKSDNSNLLYTPEGIKNIKEKSGLNDEILNDSQITELYEIACAKVVDANTDISVFDYIKLNVEYVKNKDGVIHKFAYLKSAIQNDYAKALPILYLSAINKKKLKS